MKPFLVILLALCCAGARAAPFPAYHISDPQYALRFDGTLQDPAWSRAAVSDGFFENLPLDRVAAGARTEVRVLYDSAYLYIGVKAYDPLPDAIRAPFARRDRISGEQDSVTFYLDATGGRKAAQLFRVNARGSLSDGTYNDQAGEDLAPDVAFAARTAAFDGGWSAEIRIPYASLIYTDPARTPWNLLVMRNMTRTQRVRMASQEMPRDTSCTLCYAEPITGMRALEPSRSWSVIPQLVVRSSRDSAAGKGRDLTHDLSLDMEARVAAGTVLAATLNPDFSDTELDAPQLSGNTSFSLFTPEKRTFFLQGADIFSMPQRAVHTRAVTDPAWGIRVTDRTQNGATAALTARDQGGGVVLIPGAYGTAYARQNFNSQVTLVRSTRRVGDTALGAVLTDRTLEHGRGYNRVLGGDAVWQKGDGPRVQAQLLVSETTALPDSAGELAYGAARRGHAGYVDWMMQAPQWYGELSVQDISRNFRADNGFFSQAGFTSVFGEVRRKFGKQGVLNAFNLYAFGENKTDTDGSVLFRGLGAGAWMQGPFDSTVNIQLKPVNRTRIRQGGPLFAPKQLWMRAEWT
ncbi:MAG TPA: carbohydrate binding family 9 domain-containing protein, partial [Burkholderiaceae bacterium]